MLALPLRERPQPCPISRSPKSEFTNPSTAGELFCFLESCLTGIKPPFMTLERESFLGIPVRMRTEAESPGGTGGGNLPILAFVPALLLQDYSLPGGAPVPTLPGVGGRRAPRAEPPTSGRILRSESVPDK
jgi:hypothetical protein